ncbi:MAG: (2Fe-2S) ferredoxin domain-containing protein [Pleurocapsa sp.]
MITAQPLVSEFTVVGKLEDLVISSKGCVKYLYLSSQEEDYSIEVAKQKKLLSQNLKPGCYLRVTGMRKYKLHQEKVEYKAYRIELLPEPATFDNVIATTNSKAKVLICQGSSCWKNGGKTTCELLQIELQVKGITDKVEIKTTGCLKQCKQAPNIVIMPGNNRYSRVQPKQLSQLIAKHLS